MGTHSVIDDRPRAFGPDEIRCLGKLAGLVEALQEERGVLSGDI